MSLALRRCIPCEKGTAVLSEKEVEKYLGKVRGWSTSEHNKKIFKNFVFTDFKEALEFINKVGEIAESESHHPDMHLYSYKKVTVELSTHAIGGLSENDFILAAKIDTLVLQ